MRLEIYSEKREEDDGSKCAILFPHHSLPNHRLIFFHFFIFRFVMALIMTKKNKCKSYLLSRAFPSRIK